MSLERRLFLQSSIFMQRVGHLRILAAAMAGKHPRPLERAATDVARLIVGQRVPSSRLPHDNLALWIRKRQQTEKYAREATDGDGAVPARVQLQDAYLSDPALPSFTGSLTSSTAIEIVRWGVQLGLLRDSGVLSSLGDMYARLDAKILPKEALSGYSPFANPYLLIPDGLKLAWGLLVVAADWEVLSRLLPRLPIDTEFDRAHAGDLLVDVFQEIHEGMPRRTTNRKEEAARASVAAGLKSLDEQRAKGASSRGIREHLIAVRLEPLVDTGLLSKEDPFRWRYTLSATTADALKELIVDQTWPKIKPLIEAMGLHGRQLEDLVSVWKWLYRGYVLSKSPVGFAGLTEVLIAALALALNEGEWFEWSHAHGLVMDAQRAAPKEVRFNVDRYGKLRHIRLPEEPPPLSHS